MQKVLLAAALSALAAAPALAAPAGKTLTGAIVRFECGDNCYLVVKDARGKETTGMCEAKACEPWFERQAIPKKLIGKSVTVGLGRGKQVDGEGNVMGETLSFKTLEFAK